MFNALSIAPLISSDPHSKLPTCCRRNGKHHCSMVQMGEGATESPGFAAGAPKCPLFPKAVPVAQGIQLYPFATRSFLEGIVNQSQAPSPVEIQYRVSSPRAHQKRGPP